MCSAVSASAKLGETVPQLIKRFGKSYRIESANNGNKYEFRSEKVRVDVLVSNDVSIAETYFSDHALTANGQPPNDIVRAILKTNDPKARWLEIDAAQFRSDYALRSSDQKYIAFLRYTGPQAEGFIWTMTVGAAKTLSSLSSPPPSPLASSEPSALSKSGPKPGETKEQYEQRVLAEALARDPGKGQEARRAKPVDKPNFILVIESGLIKVCNQKGDELGEVAAWAFLDSYAEPQLSLGRDLIDGLRHLVLDAVASWHAGGARSTMVDPAQAVVTSAEYDGTLRTSPSVTIERGAGFFILKDSLKPCEETCKGERYRAEIGMISREEMAKATARPTPAAAPSAVNNDDAAAHQSRYIDSSKLPPDCVALAPDQVVDRANFWDKPPTSKPANVPAGHVLVKVYIDDELLGWVYMDAKRVAALHGLVNL